MLKLIEFQKLVRRVPIADNVIEYAVQKVKQSRPDEKNNSQLNDWINWGAGPRASQYLVIAAKSKAIMDKMFLFWIIRHFPTLLLNPLFNTPQ